jgi:hypothetical protein
MNPQFRPRRRHREAAVDHMVRSAPPNAALSRSPSGIVSAVRRWRAGIEIHKRDGDAIRVYSAAKTVADCFMFRHQLDVEVVIEEGRSA